MGCRVRHGRDARRRIEPICRVERIAQGQGVSDREHDLLRTREQGLQSRGDPQSGRNPALTVTGRGHLRRRRPGPVAVCGERPSLEGAEGDLVEERLHDALDLPLPQGELERLARALEPAGDTDLDGLARELRHAAPAPGRPRRPTGPHPAVSS